MTLAEPSTPLSALVYLDNFKRYVLPVILRQNERLSSYFSVSSLYYHVIMCTIIMSAIIVIDAFSIFMHKFRCTKSTCLHAITIIGAVPFYIWYTIIIIYQWFPFMSAFGFPKSNPLHSIITVGAMSFHVFNSFIIFSILSSLFLFNEFQFLNPHN